MNIPPPDENWYDTFAIVCIAGIAGLLGHLMRSMNERRAVTWPRSLIETLASGFIGFLTVKLCRATGVPYEWMGFAAGVLGWLGAATSMVLFERSVRKRLGLNDVPEKPVVQQSSELVGPGGDSGGGNSGT